MHELDSRILRAMVDHQRLAMDFAYLYEPKLFLDDNARRLGRAMIDYVRTYRSRPTERSLTEKAENDELKELIKNYFSSLSDDDKYDEADYNLDIEKLKNRYSNFLVQGLKKHLPEKDVFSTDSAQDAINLIERISTEVQSVNKERAFVKKTLKSHVADFRKSYVSKMKSPELGRGILTGYSFLDFIKNGLRPADLMLICGETGTGKSMFLNNIAVNMWKQENKIDMSPDEYTGGYNVMYFSLEMPHEDCFRRTISMIADVPYYGIRDASLNTHEAKVMAKALDFMEKFPYEFDIIDVPRGFSANELELHFQEARSRYRPDVIIIDYLGLMEDIRSDGDQQDWLKLGQLTGKVHEFARAHQIPVVSAVQLNRVDKSNKNAVKNSIGLHRIGRSSLIAHHSTLVIQIKDPREDESSYSDFEYHIIKNRDGELGSHNIWKNFAHSLITDKPYDSTARINYTARDDISGELAGVVGNIVLGVSDEES